MIIATITINADTPDDIPASFQKLLQDLRSRDLHEEIGKPALQEQKRVLVTSMTDHSIATMMLEAEKS